MTASFEGEVRFPIGDIEAFRERLRGLGAEVVEEYAFTDHYYQPRGGQWDPRLRALRIREHLRPDTGCEILLTSVDILDAGGLKFKRSRFAQGKVRLFAGTLEDCRLVLETLGCAPWLTVRKLDGTLYTATGLGEFIAEYVDGIGWMSEIEVEGADPAAGRAIEGKLRALGISPQAVTSDSIAAIASSGRDGRAPSGAGADATSVFRAGKKVYFCGSIRGGRSLQPLYAGVVAFLARHGYEVLTRHVAAPDVLAQEWREGVMATDIYLRDLRWLAECDLVIAEVSTPSLGVGVEITEAQRLGKPVLCLCQRDVALSAMVGGNPALPILRYRDETDLLQKLGDELAGTRERPGSGSASHDDPRSTIDDR